MKHDETNSIAGTIIDEHEVDISVNFYNDTNALSICRTRNQQKKYNQRK